MARRSDRSRAEVLWDALRKTREPGATPDRMVRDLYGETRRGTPDTRGAAEALGVSQRTVQRWIRYGMPRRSDAAGQLNQRHVAWRASAAGRQARMGSRRESRLRNRGTTIRFTGLTRVSADLRPRRGMAVVVPPEHMRRILDAALAGDDELALARLEDGFGPAFGGPVELPEIDDLDTQG